MRNGSRTRLASFALLAGLFGVSAQAAVSAGPGTGVLDELAVPNVPAADHGDDDHARTPRPTDAVAVPTPTAAASGLVVLSLLVLCRTGRRVLARL
jgi:hypothetical protein